MKITTEHIFMMMEIIDKTNIADELEKIGKISFNFSENDTNEEKLLKIKKAQENQGLKVVVRVVPKLYKAKKELYVLMADLKETTPEEIKKMEVKDLKDFIMQLAKEGIIEVFFKQATDPKAD